VNGARVGITADRRAAEQAALVRALGGEPVMGPALRADAPARPEAVLAELDAALSAPIDVAVMLTGAGVDLLVAAAEAAGRGRALRALLAGARVLARGPKPRRALRAAGIRVDEAVDPPRAEEVVARVLAAGAGGRRVMVQGFGPPPDEVAVPLRRAGARVVAVSPYASGWPDDAGPARALARAAREGRIEAITFTSAQAARQFAALAESAGVEPSEVAGAGALIASVGPVTSRALEGEGVPVHVEPSPHRMGALYRALAAALAGPARGGGTGAGGPISDRVPEATGRAPLLA
jgi:uroporphyrinogen-III synthase